MIESIINIKGVATGGARYTALLRVKPLVKKYVVTRG
jgi:hypothetical protein